MHESGGTADHTGCILAHDLVNKLTAIIGYCDILATKAEHQADQECREHLGKVRDLATGMALMVQQSKCAVQALNDVMALKHAFSEEHRNQLPGTEHFEVEDAVPFPK